LFGDGKKNAPLKNQSAPPKKIILVGENAPSQDAPQTLTPCSRLGGKKFCVPRQPMLKLQWGEALAISYEVDFRKVVEKTRKTMRYKIFVCYRQTISQLFLSQQFDLRH
jgi:hypothetical protein